MEFVADLHIHSKYSRATSPRSDLENLNQWAKIKGIKVLGTGDFTHPQWFSELKKKLEPAEAGFFRLKKASNDVRFVLSSEISCIYSKKGRARKIHIVVLAPSFKIVERINTQLSWIGNLGADGRPILGLDAKKLIKIVLETSRDCFVVPAHIWSPWFSLFGSRSGFDSMEECFEEYTKDICACETGISSDPPMNRRLSNLDKIALVSNSDAHSPEKIGREANVFDTEFSYFGMVNAIKSKDPQKFLYTIEFFPQEGKYYHDGHRKCGVSFPPKETKKCGGVCPVCGQTLTIGVLNRVDQLADREEGFKSENAIPFKSLIPLEEIIIEAMNMSGRTKTTRIEYDKLINSFDNELNILLAVTREDLEKITLSKIAEGIIRVRKGNISVEPGYDGVYGKIRIFGREGVEENKDSAKQKPLF